MIWFKCQNLVYKESIFVSGPLKSHIVLHRWKKLLLQWISTAVHVDIVTSFFKNCIFLLCWQEAIQMFWWQLTQLNGEQNKNDRDEDIVESQN